VTEEEPMDIDPTRNCHTNADARNLPVLRLEVEHSAERRNIEQLVADRFAQQFAAHVNHFLPLLLGLHTGDGYTAVAGLRPGGSEELFLEQYLDRLAEQEISHVFHTPVDRCQIVEIGHLVATEPGAGYLMFACLAPLLRAAGFRWVICTATPQVERMLNKMCFDPVRICKADPARLNGSAADWGHYYDSRPHVIAGDLRNAGAVIDWNLLPDAFRQELSGLATRLQKIRQPAS
jgi:hypothetical protein